MSRDVRTTLAGTACLIGLLIGCGDQPGTIEPTKPAYRVRLLTSVPVSGRWERAAEEGLGRIAAELAADVGRIRTGAGARAQDAMERLGAEGVELVFCVGPGFENEVFANAPVYPATRFVLLPGRASGDNVTGVEFVPDGAGYVAGVVAATLGASTTVGVLRGSGGPWLDLLENGFVKGFLSEGQRHQVVVASASESPWKLVRNGANVALYATDRPDPVVFSEAHDAGLLLVVTDEELIADEPDVVALAIRVDVAEAMIRIARSAVDGSLSSGVYSFDLGSGVMGVRINDSLPELNLPEVREALDVAQSEVTAGLVEMEELGF
jgi:basic membrane lipoprotein Med (substrate-binding protein (PBP1-ABC) superfamily)